MRTVADSSVIVTGGGSGLGAATAAHLAERGARVTICGRRPEKVRTVAEAIGPAAAWVQADVDDPDDRARLVDAAVDHGGGIDVLVHCAGNLHAAPLAEIDEEDLVAMYRTNVISPTMLTQRALPHLVARQGAVVFVGAVDVRRVMAPAAVYAPSKAAVHRLTEVLAVELGPQGVRVSCVAVGAVATEIAVRSGALAAESAAREVEETFGPVTPLRRTGDPREVAEAIEHLAYAEWTTGAILDVDGGLGLGELEV
ncbi:SDR family NAD(P)-dependent oxidoreductase [Iamia majanohamensis]|uniref:SDR family NAD(P)-dependent oxidoreductase n=1 Tax=Iamia majanohamensis TaxID=467976 RepID=A0AAF0BUQ6_9ACTN|nr:SDR family oxidoreductase [Iamia majanohamensis]WCO68062.1 SDR family NAD(P)-dependent oxidoreductase [Iamia majanohamensis]